MPSRFILPSAIACLLAACASSPKPATAVTAPVDPATQRWQTYERMEGAYYLLDKQDFSQLSCHIDVPVADKFVQQLRVSMAHVADKIDFTDTLSSYRLTYSKLTGLHIEDPTIDVQVKPGVQIPDPAKVEKGRTEIHDGFSHLIQGVDAEITGLLSLLESGKPQDIDVQSIRETPGGYEFSMLDKRSNMQMTGTRSGMNLDTKFNSPAGDTTSTETLMALPDGKLVPKTIVIDTKQQQLVDSHVSVSMDYQPVGGLTFPSRIAVQATTQSLNTTQMNTTFDIAFTDCTLTK